MARPGKPSPEDVEEFRRSVGPVRRLTQDRVSHPRQAPAPRPRKPVHDPVADSPDDLSDGLEAPTVGATDALLFVRPGVQHRQLQQLRRGQLRNQATLDLHGLSAALARQALGSFIAQCQSQQLRHVLIIHGKGFGRGADQPVLKNRVNTWLRQHPAVLAFSSAQLRDGGTGALYVLLRARRD